jgi:hypothetical protein
MVSILTKSRYICVEIYIKIIFNFYFVHSISNDIIFFDNQIIEILNYLLFSIYIIIDFCYISYLLYYYQILTSLLSRNEDDNEKHYMQLYKKYKLDSICMIKCIFSFYFIFILFELSKENFRKCSLYNFDICMSYFILLFDTVFLLFRRISNFISSQKSYKQCSPLENDDCCSICLDNPKKEKWTQLSCHHKYHIKCIKQWFDNSESCPTCRNIKV